MDDMMESDGYGCDSGCCNESPSLPPMCPNCSTPMGDLGDKWACQMCSMMRDKVNQYKDESTCEAPAPQAPIQCLHPLDKQNAMPFSGKKFCSLCGDWI